MTHEGRMLRGEQNYLSGNKKLLENEDTKYFLENKPKEEEKPEPKKKKAKDEVKKEDGNN